MGIHMYIYIYMYTYICTCLNSWPINESKIQEPTLSKTKYELVMSKKDLKTLIEKKPLPRWVSFLIRFGWKNGWCFARGGFVLFPPHPQTETYQKGNPPEGWGLFQSTQLMHESCHDSHKPVTCHGSRKPVPPKRAQRRCQHLHGGHKDPKTWLENESFQVSHKPVTSKRAQRRCPHLRGACKGPKTWLEHESWTWVILWLSWTSHI